MMRRPPNVSRSSVWFSLRLAKLNENMECAHFLWEQSNHLQAATGGKKLTISERFCALSVQHINRKKDCLLIAFDSLRGVLSREC